MEYIANQKRIFQIIADGTPPALIAPSTLHASSSITVTHKLGMKPIVTAYVQFSVNGTKYPLPYNAPDLSGTGNIMYQVTYGLPDNNTVVFTFNTITGGQSVQALITYYLSQEVPIS